MIPWPSTSFLPPVGRSGLLLGTSEWHRNRTIVCPLSTDSLVGAGLRRSRVINGRVVFPAHDPAVRTPSDVVAACVFAPVVNTPAGATS